MAFGIVPRYSKTEKFENSTDEILLLAVEAAKNLQWEVGHIARSRVIAYTSFSMTSWSERITIDLAGQEATVKSECNGNQFFDWGKNKKNVEAFFEKFYQLRAAMPPEELSVRQLALEVSESPAGEPFETGQSKMGGFLSVFVPAEGYFITPILVWINLILFALMVITGADIWLPDTDTLLAWGANFRPVTINGQWWRLLTSCFLHIGLLHLVMNMYALIYIGLLLEPRLGRTRFLAVYLLTGIAASTASLWWNDLIISAGASGAIFGMYGFFLAMLTTNVIDKASRQAFLASILVFVGYNLVGGLRGGIDNAAHIGGLLSGLLAGYAFYPSLKKPGESALKFGTIGVLTVLVVAGAFFVMNNSTNPVDLFQQKMNRIVELEQKALKVFNMADASDAEILAEVQQNGIPAWNEALKILAEADALDIPATLHDQNYKMKTYCNLRLEVFKLIVKGIEEDTEQYLSQIDDLNRQIEVVVSQIVRDAGQAPQ